MSEDGEVVDPTKQIRQDCIQTCPKQSALYEKCIQRITASGEGDCEAWFIDLLTCADKCIAPKVFSVTKGG